MAMISLRSEIVAELERWYGPQRVERMVCALATPPGQTTIRCNALVLTPAALAEMLNMKFSYAVSFY